MRLLLDAHLSPGLAEALQQAGVDAVGLQRWHDGELLNSPDEEILVAAIADDRILVTSDRATMPAHLRRLAEDGVRHSGVVFVRTVDSRASRIGSVSRRLVALLQAASGSEWTDRVVYLPPDRGD
jgi:predicted nuclease of predicted toxin-antitoxin system